MAPVATKDAFSHWRSPMTNSADLPGIISPSAPRPDLIHPSFLPTCEVGRDGGEMHSHAFDLLSLAGAPSGNGSPSVTTAPLHGAEPASVPNPSYLSSTRPSNGHPAQSSTATQPPKARRMSSSTHGVLGRGKLGLTGDPNLGKDPRPSLSTSITSAAPIPARRASNAASKGPYMFDFATTDGGRRPPLSRSSSNRPAPVAASLPARGLAGGARQLNPPPVVQTDDMELDMAFDGDDDDDERSRSRSGSAELDMEMDEAQTDAKLDWDKLALGTGSGGIKGRRRGMVFKCETCSKEYRHPSCLIKHRWEHSPHWREPTQISMSKHQQVQMLEAAAILSHINPESGRSLPNDKSLWPAVLSPEPNHAVLRSAKSTTRDLPSVRSPRSQASPLSPGSFRDFSNFPVKDRKSSPASDSTSSMGPDASPHPNSLGLENSHARPMGINNPGRRTSVSSVGGPTTPASVGSLPDVGGLHFHAGSTPTTGASPLPNRALSLNARMRMPGGGMFGPSPNGGMFAASTNGGVFASTGPGLFGPNGTRASSFRLPDSDVRGGRGRSAEEDDELGRGKSSSEEVEERRRDEESFAVGEMEL